MATNEFFLIDDIKKGLHCAICESPIDIPKIIPCGKTICSSCESSYIHSPDEKCKSCSAVHEIPPDGFPVNDFAATFLKLAPAKVYRGEVHKQTLETVNEIAMMNQKLQDQLKNIDSVVGNYCDVLRFSVEVKTESEINQLKNHRDLFLSRIDSYEKQCKEKSRQESLKAAETISKCQRNNINWTQFLKKEDISDKETTVVFKEAIQEKNSLVTFKNQLEKSIFGSRKLVFHEAKTHAKPSILGSITGCINTSHHMQFNYATAEATYYYDSHLLKISNETSCMLTAVYHNRMKAYCIHLSITLNRVVVKEIFEPVDKSYYNKFAMANLKDHIVVCWRTHSGQFTLMKYDVNLKFVKSVNPRQMYAGIFTEANRYHCFSSDSSFWDVYDENLHLLESIRADNGSTYPFIMHKDSQVELKYGYLFLYYNRELRVVDNGARTLVASLKLDGKAFPNPVFVRPCSSDTFYVIDPKSKTVQSFDFDLNCFFESGIETISQISSVSLTHDGDLVVYDHKATTAYLFKKE